MDDRTQALVSTLKQLQSGHTDRKEEAAILALLRGLADDEFAALLLQIDLYQLIHDVDDHILGPRHRTELLTLLCKERISVLPPAVRGALVQALQKGRTGAAAEEAILDVFLASKGVELTALKQEIDAGDDYHDLQQLIMRDIDDDRIRRRLLGHIQAEAVRVSELKVLSDIDDTFYCNWIDARYPKGTVYPGVRQFYAELDRVPEGGRAGDLAFLTARPGDRAGLFENVTHENLKRLGVRDAVVLSGDLAHVATNELIAQKKYSGFVEYQTLFPEYRFVFLGDSGQGDVLCGRLMRTHHPDHVRAVFIHDVTKEPTPAEVRKEHRALGIYFHDTYVGAATMAHELGLISREGLLRVANAAQADLAKIAFTDEQREKRQMEFARDLALIGV